MVTIQSPEMLDMTKTIQLPAVLGVGGGTVLLEELVFTLLKI
jgi:hypothetical protein